MRVMWLRAWWASTRASHLSPLPAPIIITTPTHPPREQVRPLRRQLTGLKAWITGQRKDQSPGTRMAVPAVQVRARMGWLQGWLGGCG